MKNSFEIPYYADYISESLAARLLSEAKTIVGVKHLKRVGAPSGLETPESLQFIQDLYLEIKNDLANVLKLRQVDRTFIDERVKSYYQFNQEFSIPFTSADYQTVLGNRDSENRIVIGPLRDKFYAADLDPSKRVAPIPEYLQCNHITLFGPPDSAKLSVNAMNAFDRKLPGEPEVVARLADNFVGTPMWGADDEDSKTPLEKDLVEAAINLKGCFNGDLNFKDPKNQKEYKITSAKKSFPIKRFPGLALPCQFLWHESSPIPLHLYDFALHLYEHWHNPKALVFYVPKLENEGEARYIKTMFATAEKLIQKIHPEYVLGTVRCIIVLENPRAVFRLNEMMDELYPYFLGASLGWHDYLGSTARLFKEDANYRIPVKADPNIVIKYIKASHELVTEIVKKRGGINIGGMYGILPVTTDLTSDSFQITLKGYFKDVITQMKRGLHGFWVAHPDFVRIGIAIVEAWKEYAKGDESALKELIFSLLQNNHAQEIWNFFKADDVKGLEVSDPLYARSLIVADLNESEYIANNDPKEIRYNVFQSLQYITDWLSGNGCVALPALIENTPVRVMDDLATAERSRWEVWHEIYHGRFAVEDLVQIAHEEMNFIRRDLSDSKKIVQVKYTHANAHWYEIALKLMLKLMCDPNPVEFATELLIPFSCDFIRSSEDPWATLMQLDAKKYKLPDYIERFNYYFELCGQKRFACEQAKNIAIDIESVKKSIQSFNLMEIIEAASFHGNIGQASTSLDAMAKKEQADAAKSEQAVRDELLHLGEQYQNKFGVKFLISAKGKSAEYMLENLKSRLENSKEQEMVNAKDALETITLKRLQAHPLNMLTETIQKLYNESSIKGLQISIATGKGKFQNLNFECNEESLFEIASLSKSFASAFCLEFFKEYDITPDTSVNAILRKYKSSFLLTSSVNTAWEDMVQVKHLMSHSALNMHYVNGVPVNEKMPAVDEFLNGNAAYDYPPVDIIHEPGTKFKYSGAGFLVLEYLAKLVMKESFQQKADHFFEQLGIIQTSFKHYENTRAHEFGRDDKGAVIGDKLKQFPLFAAGMYGTAQELNQFLEHLACAHSDLYGSGGIGHDTAILMLDGKDIGSQEFMAANMGLGIFTLEAGENRFMLHQGANDGFRAIFLYCYKGPDKFKGISILATGELEAVILNAKMVQQIFKTLAISGIDYSKFNSDFTSKNLAQEEIVNIGYKKLLLDAFLPDQPEPIIDHGPLDPLSKYNLAVNAKIIKVSNERFAQAANLFSTFEPKFDPTLFGKQGKVMDSWEGARHNEGEFDFLDFTISNPAQINYVFVSTKYHFGNQVERFTLLAKNTQNQYVTLIADFPLLGHGHVKFALLNNTEKYSEFRLKVYPDGGISRLGLYADLPADIKKDFLPITSAKCTQYDEVIPLVKKPMTLAFDHLLAKGFKQKKYNYACALNGAKIQSATDEHYAPASSILSPFRPLNMFDGLESKRSRVAGHYEQVIIDLADTIDIGEIILDFTYFVNNNPKQIKIEGFDSQHWSELVQLTNVKPYAGNKISFLVRKLNSTKSLKITIFPDGGVNRILVYKK